MTIDEITKERNFATKRIEAVMSEFIERTGLKEFQVKASWGPVQVSAFENPTPSHVHTMHLATIVVTI